MVAPPPAGLHPGLHQDSKRQRLAEPHSLPPLRIETREAKVGLALSLRLTSESLVRIVLCTGYLTSRPQFDMTENLYGTCRTYLLCPNFKANISCSPGKLVGGAAMGTGNYDIFASVQGRYSISLDCQHYSH